jgi:Cu(I)/Ag(I) efflux system membrane fusion protein
MKREARWIMAVALMLAIGAAGYWIGSHRAATPALPVAAPSAPATGSETATGAGASLPTDPKTGRRVLYWHDPMVPGQKFDHPGKSPFMDMELVPVFADETAADGVTISSSMASNLGIRTATARRAKMATKVEVTGSVAENERATAVVQARVTGYIEKLFARANFDAVAAGQPVAVIYAPEWAAAQAEYLALRRAHADATLVEAARQRLRLLSIPDSVITAAERADTPETRFSLLAPRSGIVMDLAVREGAMVTPGMTLMRIVSLSDVWVYAEVPENIASSVRIGAVAQVALPSAPEQALSGRVSALLPQVNAVSRTVRARIELPNPKGLLKPGMLVNVALAAGSEQDATVVPQEAVISTGRRNVVIVRASDGRFRPVDVVIGQDVGSDIEIRKGVEPGQIVVASGQFLLDSEASLKSALTRLDTSSAAMPAPAMPDATAPAAGADPHAGHALPAAPNQVVPASPRPSSANPPAGHTTAAPLTSPSAKVESYEGTGRLEAIAVDRLTLSHEPIPALQWPAMTMGFRPPKEGVPAGVKAGDNVRFTFARSPDGGYQVTRIEPAAGGAHP